jgi:hypothetical protein
MDNGLKGLLESGILNEDTKLALEEAWNTKLEEVRSSLREEVETQVREEFSERFELDKNNLVEAMDNMLTDAVQTYAAEAVEATKALKEERIALTQAIKEERAAYKAKLAENTERLNNFVMTMLGEEIGKVKAQEKALAESNVTAAKKLREHRTALNEQAATRINKLEGFVLEQLTRELAELNEDNKALVEARVRLVTESKQKLDETKKAFIARASKLVESTVESHLRRELTQLKEDIKSARENLFGRRLFEAFQAEFMTSYLSEGSEVKKLNAQLTESKAALAQAANKLAEKDEAIAQSVRRAKLAEERATRVKTMNELLSPLSKEKRNVMEELLESVKTDKLTVAFQKYLPTVLNEGTRSVNQGRRVLSETAPVIEKKTVAVTGNRHNRLAESARAEEVPALSDQDRAELRRLAGIE